MSEGGGRLNPSFGVPMQTFRDKVDEQLIVAAQNLGKRLGPGSSASAFGIYDRSRVIHLNLSNMNVQRGKGEHN